MKIWNGIKDIYNKPHHEKSGIRLIAEMCYSMGVGILMGWGISRFAITSDPLWTLLVIPGVVHFILIGRNLRRLNKAMKERHEAFKKEHGVDMITYVEQAIDEMEIQKDGNK